MPPPLLDQLEKWKSRFGPPGDGQLERLLATAARRQFRDAASLIRLHETALFLRAYPRNPEVARLADSILFSFAGRVAELEAFEAPEISGIAGTSLSAVFSYEVARRLAARHPRNLEIAWDRYDNIDRLGPVLRRFLPLLGEDWPVEAHVPYRQWISAARPSGKSDLAWLLKLLAAQPELFDTLELPLTWRIGNARTSRSRLRLPGRKLYCHQEPLLRRSDVSLARELEAPPVPVRRLSRPEARKILDLILDTSAMRYRELYGFSHPDEGGVFHADAGRGVDIFFFGVPPAWRLPLRAYHGGLFFKNGVPAGYVEVLSLFERAEVGFNLYYTFREGESAWIYARLLRLFRQVLGVTCFSVDPYQIGLENPEAVDSGAFWFYRKLGFRPVDPKVAALMDREERRMRQTPGYRSSKRTLEKLADGYILFETPSSEKGAWDNFRVRKLCLAAPSSSGLAQVMSLIPDLAHWTPQERTAAAKILRAKESGSEARYLWLMQRHARLRAAFLALGSGKAKWVRYTGRALSA
ncbi:MAG TPA: hypothetical protein VKF41_00245 [Bryobacteraceae bacterium]|nr:hypothetical protein [Bryobacteraceae bacterium]